MELKLLNRRGWKTPNAYCSSFESLPQGPAVYALVRPVQVKDRLTASGQNIVLEVLYVGMSINLSKRFLNHEIKKAFDRKGEYVQVWFKRCPVDKLRKREKNLIQQYDPPYNIIHRRRGEVVV